MIFLDLNIDFFCPKTSTMPELLASAGGPATQASALFERLRADILTCALAPGEKLHIARLTAAYGVGASPLREALNRLVSEGFVTQTDQKGFRVAPISIEAMTDLTRARIWIGERALLESMRNGDAAWEERVLLSFHRWERAARSAGAPGQDAAHLHALHRTFHGALLSACGSDYMLKVWDAAFDLAQRYQFLSAKEFPAEPARDPVREHKELRDAVLARDVERASALHTEHLELTAALVAKQGVPRVLPRKTPQ